MSNLLGENRCLVAIRANMCNNRKLKKFSVMVALGLGLSFTPVEAGLLEQLSTLFSRAGTNISEQLQRQSNAGKVIACAGLALAGYSAVKLLQSGYNYYQLRNEFAGEPIMPIATTGEAASEVGAPAASANTPADPVMLAGDSAVADAALTEPDRVAPTSAADISAALVGTASVDLLALDETASAQLMAEIKVELDVIKQEFDTAVAENKSDEHGAAASACAGMYLDYEACPKIYQLLDAMLERLQITQADIKIFMGLKNSAWLHYCSAETRDDGRYDLNLGYQAIIESSYAELLALLGHELGHIQQQHNKKQGGFMQAARAMMGMAIGCCLYRQPDRWGIAKAGGVTFALLLSTIFTAAYLARRHEFAADRVSYEVVQQPEPLIRYIRNTTERMVTGDPVAQRETWLFEEGRRTGLESHPKTSAREAYLKTLHAQRLAQAAQC
ncbi:MAG TPA: M48 family metalloprotease [Candidatus Babeliales bacterium]|nr:M48 family metalloprotease [Candidatus Babeliales bacterium]